MKTLSKKQRIALYKQAIVNIKLSTHTILGLCWMMKRTQYNMFGDEIIDYYNTDECIAEEYAVFFKEGNCYFSSKCNWNTRQTILELMIAMLELE